MSHEVSEGLTCPICFEVPEAEVYQCENEHWFCNRCYFQVTPPHCPECRSGLDRDHPRRCRAIERVLEGLKVDCAFQSNGCDKKLLGGSAQGHQAECIFNFDKFGQFVNLCSNIGYPNCDFKFNNGNAKKAVEHLVSKHECILTTSEKFQMELTSFKESAKAGESGFQFWTPIIADLKEWKCYLLTMVILNKADASFTWLSIFLPFAGNEHRQRFSVEVEYTVETLGSLPSTVWIGKSMSLKEANKLLPNEIDFVNHSLLFVRRCSEEGNLLIDCDIKQHGVKVAAGKENLQSFVCTKNTNSISAMDHIQFQTSKVPVRFDRYGGSPDARSFRDKLQSDCISNRSKLLPSMRKLYENKRKPMGLTQADVEWLKTDLIIVTAQYGSVAAMKYLIGKGGNFNIVGEIGTSLLHYTMWDNDKEIGLRKAKLLFNAGLTEVNVFDNEQRSLLHLSAKYGINEAVEYFLQKGCEVNARDSFGSTPLHLVSSNSSKEEGLKIAKSLVANGADLSIKNFHFDNAFETATRFGETKIVHFLCSH